MQHGTLTPWHLDCAKQHTTLMTARLSPALTPPPTHSTPDTSWTHHNASLPCLNWHHHQHTHHLTHLEHSHGPGAGFQKAAREGSERHYLHPLPVSVGMDTALLPCLPSSLLTPAVQHCTSAPPTFTLHALHEQSLCTLSQHSTWLPPCPSL